MRGTRPPRACFADRQAWAASAAPLKEKFAGDRWISNGCVRLEDYQRFAKWVFGHVPQPTAAEQRIDLPRPIPVYLTYLTVESSPNYGVVFRPDPYGFDAQAMPQMFGPSQVAAADGEGLERRS